MRQKLIFVTLILSLGFIFCGAAPCFANRVTVTNISLEAQDTVNKTYDVNFDISWENSWFTAGAPTTEANWDAAWVFAKYSVISGETWSAWAHCDLLNTGYTAPSGSQIVFGTTEAKYKGAFIYRSSAGTGNVNWTGVKIKWNYGTGEVAVNDDSKVRLKIFAIEMVHIPRCAFYVGDTNADQTNCFYEGGTTHEFYITSEAAIAVSSTEAGKLYYDYDTANAGDQLGPIPAAFPKGYNAFYIMKYEIPQKQYCEFLNTLIAGQQTNTHNSALYFDNKRNYIKKTSTSPAFFGCDANNNAGSATAADKTKLNEADDGEWIACNWLSWTDLAAYTDWAALRPFTELEFEKACRGGQLVVDDEYAWGDPTLEAATTTLTSASTESEVPNQGNCNGPACTPDGPFRCGSYADGSSTRPNAGASYFGALDLSGSLWEYPVSVGRTGGRSFAGTHGDGIISSDGRATNADWPGYSGGKVTGNTGAGHRGGNWGDPIDYCYLSTRTFAAEQPTARHQYYGGRCARTAP